MCLNGELNPSLLKAPPLLGFQTVVKMSFNLLQGSLALL